MILWTGRETTAYATSYVSAHRWVVELSGCSISLVSQYRVRTTGEWRPSHVDCYAVSLTRHWAVGQEHVYYDGPHCFFSLGPLHVQYVPRGGWCERCMPTEEVR